MAADGSGGFSPISGLSGRQPARLLWARARSRCAPSAGPFAFAVSAPMAISEANKTAVKRLCVPMLHLYTRPRTQGLDLAQALLARIKLVAAFVGPLEYRSAVGAPTHRMAAMGRSRRFGDARLSAASPHSTNMTYANYPARLRPKGGVTIAVDCNSTTETLATSRLSSQSVSQLIPIRRRAHIPSAQFR